MKPLFLDCPPAYTRTPRASADMQQYANAVEREAKPKGYPTLWWVLMAAVMVAFAFVMGISYATP